MTATPDLLTLIVGSVLFAAIFAGVVLPAVWSARPERRAAALATLKELLAAIRRPR
jgi:hypothetical protein